MGIDLFVVAFFVIHEDIFMDIGLAVIIAITGVVASLAIGFGVWEYNRRKRETFPTRYKSPYIPGTTETEQGRRARERDSKLN